ncbi:hypothetical protein AWJ20_1309 [Sugiyamaella lignohabitans]|uniref:Bacteriophage T5 Orf172 DNA-binding domain-containing protein n=1 Tax=Sugiyamaella lignohabitans TaxID=796027 RepID=A0A167DL43_9ASCO|nr:uncharacterized protein AWJ20_1309 [Sugiyamaella lignohabitans]ANB13031.1 hypothetical protein AWJ20_1309 [Sugiyamaella lignohabitans]
MLTCDLEPLSTALPESPRGSGKRLHHISTLSTSTTATAATLALSSRTLVSEPLSKTGYNSGLEIQNGNDFEQLSLVAKSTPPTTRRQSESPEHKHPTSASLKIPKSFERSHRKPSTEKEKDNTIRNKSGIKYTKETPRCIGATKQGRRCLNKASRHTQYCHLHIDQDKQLVNMLQALSVSTRSISPGYIYVYTLEAGHKNVHVYDHDKQAFIPLPVSSSSTNSLGSKSLPKGMSKMEALKSLSSVRTSSSTQYLKSSKTMRSPSSSELKTGAMEPKRSLFGKIFHNSRGSDREIPSRAMLVKVGQTTKTPAKRLAEWRAKCQHPIVLLSPLATSSASNSFDYSKQGWPTVQARPTEAAIHNELRALFGKGHVECTGCKDHGRHNEWFLVPADRIATLFETINYWVQLYRNEQPD